ncbi:FBX7 protein, partial [Amia calva]|nr:FBX7 protein [Amia calva]
MKLRVRLNKQSSRLELEGDQPSLTELAIQVKEIILPSYGYSPDTEFTLSLNGKEPLVDSGQTLASCGIVSGDLVCVILSQDPPIPSPAPVGSSSGPVVGKQHGEKSTSGSPGAQQVQTGTRAEEAEREAEAGSFIPEPMLCSEAEDGKVPHSLEMLFHGAQCSSPSDALMEAVHLIMLETGYVSQCPDVRAGEMPAGWRAAGGLYRLHYTHPFCDHSLAMLVAVLMGDTLVINATLKINEVVDNVRKIQLKPSSYVTDSWRVCLQMVIDLKKGSHLLPSKSFKRSTKERQIGVLSFVDPGESPADVYKDLKKLSRIFKDQLVYPLIASARQAMNLPAVFGLTVLPPELLLRVLRLLDVRSVVTLSAVSRDLHTATADPTLWRFLYQRDFRDSTSRPRETDWKELYKRRRQREATRVRRTVVYPPVPSHPFPFQPLPFHPFPFGPNPPYPPGIIGGEYDQRPGLPSLMPRPRFDPLGPQPGQDPLTGGSVGRRSLRPSGSRSSDIRRGFI